MIIKIYVNWEENEILTAKEFEEYKRDRIADVLDDVFERAEYINHYLSDIKGYDYTDLLFMDAEFRQGVIDLASKYLAECIGEDIDREYKEVTLEV